MSQLKQIQHKHSERSKRGTLVRAFSHLLIGVFLATVGFHTSVAAQCEDPDTLTFSIIPTEDSVQELTIYKPVIDYMSKKTGKDIEFYMPTSYASVIEAMLGGWVDVAVHGPYSYVIGRQKDSSIEVFATYAKKPGHLQEEGPGYKAALISRKDSRFNTIRSLRGSVIGLTDPASTSGNLLPRVVFTKVINSELEDYFKKVVYTGGHDLSTLAVHEGKVDAAFVATHRFDNVVERGLVKLDDFNILWSSPTVPQDPFTYRNTLCQPLRSAIEQTFLTLHTHAPARGFLDNVNSNRFVRMGPADYNIIRDLKKAKDAKK